MCKLCDNRSTETWSSYCLPRFLSFNRIEQGSIVKLCFRLTQRNEVKFMHSKHTHRLLLRTIYHRETFAPFRNSTSGSNAGWYDNVEMTSQLSIQNIQQKRNALEWFEHMKRRVNTNRETYLVKREHTLISMEKNVLSSGKRRSRGISLSYRWRIEWDKLVTEMNGATISIVMVVLHLHMHVQETNCET